MYTKYLINMISTSKNVEDNALIISVFVFANKIIFVFVFVNKKETLEIVTLSGAPCDEPYHVYISHTNPN